MIPSLVTLGALVSLVFLGFVIQRRAAIAPERTRAIIRALHPNARSVDKDTLEFNARDHDIIAKFTKGAIELSTLLPATPLAWRTAARALGDGQTMALLSTPKLQIANDKATLTVPRTRLNTRGVRAGINTLETIVTRLEALSLPEALARHLLEHAAPDARLAFLMRLTADYPDAWVTRQCALSCAAEQGRPDVSAAARDWLNGRKSVLADPSV